MYGPCSTCGNPRETQHRYCRSCKAAYNRRWRKSHPAYGKNRAFNPEGIKAKSRIFVEKRAGRITPPLECERCGTAAVVHGHHEDYSQPLEILWVCQPCHYHIHNTKI